MRADGTGKTKLLETEEINDQTRFRLTFDDGWIYFANVADSYTLYKMRTDGSEKTKLNDDEFSVVQTISDGWVYYQSNSTLLGLDGDANEQCEVQGKTYMIRIDGSGKREIAF